MIHSKIRVMIIDDSLFFREFMSRSLSQDPAIEVVGMAANVYDAQKKLGILKPDVITLDMEMPKARGTEILRFIGTRCPEVHAVVISSNPHHVFEALHAGAVEFVAKPNSQSNIPNDVFIREVISKIKIAAVSTFISRVVPGAAAPAPRNVPALKTPSPAAPPVPKPRSGDRGVIAIGASTGGTEAILTVLKDLPTDIPGIVIVQHMPPVFTRMYAERLNTLCQITVREARNGDRVLPGTALLAPGDMHMRLRQGHDGYYVQVEEGEKVSGHCPSVDVLFGSVARYAGASAVGVILTGMGADGAKSMLAMRKAGAWTLGQDRATCVVYGMPMAAYNAGAVCQQLPLDEISVALVRHFGKSYPAP